MSEEIEEQEQEPEILNLMVHPNDVLRVEARAFEEDEFGTENVDLLAKSMIATMLMYKGIGLAGNQVGVDRRIFVKREPDGTCNAYLNPTFHVTSERMFSFKEGCLSLPGIFGTVRRPAEIYLTAYDVEGNKIERELKDLDSTIVQHEVDHLDGLEFVDRMTKFAKQRMVEKAKKQAKKNKQVSRIIHDSDIIMPN